MVIENKQEISARETNAENQTQFPSIIERILRGVDNGLESYGKNVKEVFYSEMEASQDMKRSEIVDFPDKFEKSLSLFFTVGTSIVNRSIGREILREFDLPGSAGLNFKTAIEIVKRHPHREVS
jgi:hypothetical protein